MTSKIQKTALACIAAAIVGVILGGAMALLRVSLQEGMRFQNFSADLLNIPAKPPSRLPIPSQSDIDLAMSLYSIQTGPNIEGPFFDMDLEDRGLTTGTTLPGPRTVKIGPAAFTSWAVLGSTLGHEIEVHGNQSFLKIVMQDEFSQVLHNVKSSFSAEAGPIVRFEMPLSETHYGTWKAEREAYLFELSMADRFGLSKEEKRLIQELMDAYYPDTEPKLAR